MKITLELRSIFEFPKKVVGYCLRDTTCEVFHSYVVMYDSFWGPRFSPRTADRPDIGMKFSKEESEEIIEKHPYLKMEAVYEFNFSSEIYAFDKVGNISTPRVESNLENKIYYIYQGDIKKAIDEAQVAEKMQSNSNVNAEKKELSEPKKSSDEYLDELENGHAKKLDLWRFYHEFNERFKEQSKRIEKIESGMRSTLDRFDVLKKEFDTLKPIPGVSVAPSTIARQDTSPWHPVSEPPKKNNNVLIEFKSENNHRYYQTGYYEKGYFQGCDFAEGLPIRWMEIPE